MTSPANERGGHARPRRPFAPRPRDNGRHDDGPETGTPLASRPVLCPVRPLASRPASCPARPPNLPATPSPGPQTWPATRLRRPARLRGTRGPASGRPGAPGDLAPGRNGTGPQPQPSGSPAPGAGPVRPSRRFQPRPHALAGEKARQAVTHRRARHRGHRRPGRRPGQRVRDGTIRRAHRAGVPARLAAAAVRRRGQDDHGRARYRHHGPAERLHPTRRHPADPVHEVSRPARRDRGRLVHGDGRSRPAGTRVDLRRPFRAAPGERRLEGRVGAERD